MPASRLNTVLGRARAALERRTTGEPDAALLRRYVRQRDQTAFEALVRRHGPMVLGVCRRVLRNAHDAEDAFQATFLVLVKKAAGLRSPGTVASWLYGVAYRTALHAQDAALKRRAKEAEMVPPTPAAEKSCTDLRLDLDRELGRLPEKYRAVLVLCDLEGRTRKEAARHLGWPEGTVASRLAEGRKRLARRLTRLGLAVSGGALAAVPSQNLAAAPVRAPLVSSTLRAATLFAAGQAAAAGVVSLNVAALTEGVLKLMFVTKLKSVAGALLALGLLTLGSGLVAGQFAAANARKAEERLGEPEVRAAAGVPERHQAEAPKDSEGELQGKWQHVGGAYGEYPAIPGVGAGNVKDQNITIDRKDWVGMMPDGKSAKTAVRLGPSRTPKTIDVRDLKRGRYALGIYKLEGDHLVICICGGAKQVRPTKFVVDDRSLTLLFYKRARAPKGGGTKPEPQAEAGQKDERPRKLPRPPAPSPELQRELERTSEKCSG